MEQLKQNYYGSLCTEMYEILHKEPPKDELEFYLSYAEKDMKILEALCGSGRFFLPFYERGFDISGIDLSEEMLRKLREKAPDAKIIQADILKCDIEEKFDYIFICASSVALFTDIELCKQILAKLRGMLKSGGKLVFSVDTIENKCEDDSDYEVSAEVKTKEGYDLILKSRNFYDEKSQTQFMPGIYELYDGSKLLAREEMDFQIHLYKFGEMEQYLKEIGFTDVKTYSSFSKEIAVDDQCEMLFFECNNC